jgi:hypothetical protein
MVDCQGFRLVVQPPPVGTEWWHLRADEKLTERRDEGSVTGIEGNHETGADLGFSGFEPLTSDFAVSQPSLTRKRSEVQIL